jgi:hypothetical protein
VASRRKLFAAASAGLPAAIVIPGRFRLTGSGYWQDSLAAK